VELTGKERSHLTVVYT